VNQRKWLENEYGRQAVDSWVLPDGDYTWVVEATDEEGHTERVEGSITLTGGDTTVPELRKFTVALPAFTPNQDGLDDRTGVAYFLNKDVDSVQVFLYHPDQPNVQFPLEEQERAAKPGEAGYHYYDYDGGVDRGADPPADGTYVVKAEARDLAGHHVVVSSTLTIEQGGKPRAEVVNGEILWSSAVRSLEGTEIYLPLGSTLVFTTYIENYGRVRHRGRPIAANRITTPWPWTRAKRAIISKLACGALASTLTLRRRIFHTDGRSAILRNCARKSLTAASSGFLTLGKEAQSAAVSSWWARFRGTRSLPGAG
jgi:hypothetical protein